MSKGPADTTIEDVASAAQYSRASVYRYFTKDELFLAVVVRAIERYAAELNQQLEGESDPAEMIVEGLVGAVEKIRAEPKLFSLVRGPASSSAAELVAGSADVAETISRVVSPTLDVAISANQTSLDVNMFAEWLVRIALSLLAFGGPSERSRTEERDFVRMALAPLMGRSLATAS